MGRKLVNWLKVAGVGGAGVLVYACTFPGDFDELETGLAATTGGTNSGGSESGGSSGSSMGGEAGASGGGSTSSGGSGGSGGSSCGICDDRNPCTEDVCVTEGGSAECDYVPREGVFPDGYRDTIAVDRAHRVTTAQGNGSFYLSLFETTSDTPEVTLYELEEAGDRIVTKATGADFLPMGQTAASALGMVTSKGAPFRLHAFLGVDDLVGPGRVQRVSFDANLDVNSTEVLSTTYVTDVPERAPIAWAGSGIYAAWIETLGQVAVHTLGGDIELLQTAQATAIAPLTNEAGNPGVLWGTVVGEDGMSMTTGGQVFAQMAQVGSSPHELTQCNPPSMLGDDFIAASTLETEVDGWWLGSWTRRSPSGVPISQVNSPVFCIGSFCLGGDNPDCDEADAPGLRPWAQGTAAPAGAPQGVVIHALLAPQIIGDDGPPRVDLTLLAQVIDFSNIAGDDPMKPKLSLTQVGPAVSLSSVPLEGPEDGANWPAIEVTPSGRILATWIERNQGEEDRVIVERHQVCFLPDE